MGYCVGDIELVTKDGTVVLPQSHIDIIKGSETVNLIYKGETEEKRLKLRSFVEQLEHLKLKVVANRAKRKPKARDKCSKVNCCETHKRFEGFEELSDKNTS